MADLGMTWTCQCGYRTFWVRSHCDRCGDLKPAPPPEAPLSNTPLADLTAPSTSLGWLVVRAALLLLSLLPLAAAGRFDWPSLTQAQTIAIGEGLKKLGPGTATIYCSHSGCERLMYDLDDALQIAGWPDDVWRGPYIAADERGLQVGGHAAHEVAKIIGDAIKLPVGVVAAIPGTIPTRIFIEGHP